MFSINLVSSENMIDPKTLTTGALESLAVDVKNILDERKDKVTNKESALEKISKIEEKAEKGAKDKNTKRKISGYIEDLKKSLEGKPESLDDCINGIELMNNLFRGISINIPEEEREIAEDLIKLADAIIDIKKEEARGKVSPEEWKKLPVMKLFRYFEYLDYAPNKMHEALNSSNPITKAFMEAIENYSFKDPFILKKEDFDLIIKSLWEIITRSEYEYNETVMTDKKNDINNKNPESKLFYHSALLFMERLIKESKIFDEKSIFSNYIKYSLIYDQYIINSTNRIFSNTPYAKKFIGKISNNFVRNLDARPFSFDYLYRPSGFFGSLLTFPILPITLPIVIFDAVFNAPSKIELD